MLASTLLVGAVGSALASGNSGWRNDGTGVAAGAQPPIPGAMGTAIRWKTPTRARGNASPVSFGDLVCITEEPTTLACFDKDQGQRRWSAGNNYVGTLEGDGRRSMGERLAQLDQQAERLEELRMEMTHAQRELRHGDSPAAVQPRVEALLLEMNTIKTELCAFDDYRTSEDKGLIGYATPTPVVSEGAIFAQFGNGVLSSFGPSGERRWSVWLGRQAEPMIGYDTGTAASPVMADGVLVAPYGPIRGIDPATGEVLWRGPEHRHFGTPAVARVEGEAVVVTPAGALLRAGDGAVVGPGLGEVRYVGPVADGAMVYGVGAYDQDGRERGARGTAYRLSRAGDGRLEAEQLWTRQLSSERTYTTPLLAAGRLWVVFTDGVLEVLNTDTGEQLAQLSTRLEAWSGSPSPTLGGDRVVVGSEDGVILTFSHEDQPRPVGRMELEPHLATPLLDGERIYVRAEDHLYCIE